MARTAAGRDANAAVQATFTIGVAPPFRLDLTVWALRRRPINRMDRWDGRAYGRTILVDGVPVRLTVRQTGSGAAPRLLVAAAGMGDRERVHAAAHAALDRILGLRLDLAGFYDAAAANPPLDALAQRFRGMRPPRFPSLFEALVNGVACQQISLQAGLTLLNRLVASFGGAADTSEDRAFPSPASLANAGPDTLMALGFSRAKSVAIRELALAAERGGIGDGALADLDDAKAVATLDRLRGIGRWTAEYVLLRGCGRLNVFPGDDVGARNNLQHWLGMSSPLDYDGARMALQRWRPYAGLVYLHLLLRHLDDEGTLRATVPPP